MFFYMTRSAPYEKSKFLGSGGSMVARLKLKEIDGRAPQGVNGYAVALRLLMKLDSHFITHPPPRGAVYLDCGDPLGVIRSSRG